MAAPVYLPGRVCHFLFYDVSALLQPTAPIYACCIYHWSKRLRGPALHNYVLQVGHATFRSKESYMSMAHVGRAVRRSCHEHLVQLKRAGICLGNTRQHRILAADPQAPKPPERRPFSVYKGKLTDKEGPRTGATAEHMAAAGARRSPGSTSSSQWPAGSGTAAAAWGCTAGSRQRTPRPGRARRARRTGAAPASRRLCRTQGHISLSLEKCVWKHWQQRSPTPQGAQGVI